MSGKIKILFLSIVLVLNISALTGCGQNSATTGDQLSMTEEQKENVKYKVTFIELGSVRCIPCQQMQVVMKSVEEKFGDQVNVVFYDVWTPEGKPFADIYNIELIPTQVFLDENGKEYFRHEGFFPEEELVEVLKQQGVK